MSRLMSMYPMCRLSVKFEDKYWYKKSVIENGLKRGYGYSVLLMGGSNFMDFDETFLEAVDAQVMVCDCGTDTVFAES